MYFRLRNFYLVKYIKQAHHISIVLFNDQCSHHKETSQLIWSKNQLNGFHIWYEHWPLTRKKKKVYTIFSNVPGTSFGLIFLFSSFCFLFWNCKINSKLNQHEKYNQSRSTDVFETAITLNPFMTEAVII